jgi:alcohol dehydrogenase class IV
VHVTKFLVPEVIFGLGCIDQVGESLARLGARRVFLATDPGVLGAGWVDRVLPYLSDVGLEWILWDGVTENPKDFEVHRGAEMYLAEGCDAILAVGGGSPIDAAKGVGIIASNGGSINDYAGTDKVAKPLPPMVMLPSTAGTGADISQFAVITDTSRRVKLVLVSKSLVPDISITDPTLLTTKDEELTSYTGMDALTHAIESYVSVAATPLTDVHALSAIELISQNLRPSVASRDNLTAKTNMAMASLEAGICLSNASLGATHAITHQIGGAFDVPHGKANAVVLPHVMEHNLISDTDRFARIAAAMGESVGVMSARDAAFLAVDAVRNLAEDIGIPARVTEIERLPADALNQLISNCLDDVCLVTNPRDVRAEHIERLLWQILPVEGRKADQP